MFIIRKSLLPPRSSENCVKILRVARKTNTGKIMSQTHEDGSNVRTVKLW